MTTKTPPRTRRSSDLSSGSEPIVFTHLTTLADPIRTRLLLALESEELTVGELQRVLQLPQSTVSRHLRILGEEGWLASRSRGPSNWYRMAGRSLSESGRRVWQVVRDQASTTPAARRDASRIHSVVADRQSRSREFFATTAGHWDRLRADLFGRSAAVAPFLGLAEERWTVADLGTGTGHLAEQLSGHVGRVLAVDESPEMLEAARSRLGTETNVELRLGSLDSVPIDTGTVDVAFMVLVLHHLADPAAAVAEAARILVPGGRVVIVDMAPHEHAEYRELMGHQWLGFDPESIENLCTGAGLQRPVHRGVGPDPEAKGPTLFVAAASKPNDPDDRPRRPNDQVRKGR